MWGAQRTQGNAVALAGHVGEPLVWGNDNHKDPENRFHQFPDLTDGPVLHSLLQWNFSPWRGAERFLQMFSLQQMEQKPRSITRKMDRCITFATIKIQQRLKAVAQNWEPRVDLNLFLIKSEGNFQSSISAPWSVSAMNLECLCGLAGWQTAPDLCGFRS